MKPVLHCWRLLESSEHHPQDKQENHPTQDTPGALDSHPSGPSIQGKFLLEKEIIAKSSHPTHVNSYLLFFFLTVNSFLLFLPCTVKMDGERRFPCSCSRLAHAFAFPAGSLQKGTAPTAVAGPYPQQATGAWPSAPRERRSESSCSETRLERTHTALVTFESGFKLNKPCKALYVEQKHINEVACGIQRELRNFLAFMMGW